MKLSRLLLLCLSVAVALSNLHAQTETGVGKLLFKNAMMPYPAGNDKVAFLRIDTKVPGNPMELYLGDIATGKETRLLPGEDFNDHPTPAYAFSPTGTEFAVPIKSPRCWEIQKFTVGSHKGTQVGDLSQYIELPSKQMELELAIDPNSLVEIADMTWSPTGKKLVFTMSRPGKTAVFWTDIASGKSRQATEDKTGYFPSWHPNEDQICYTDNIITEGITTNEGIVLRSITSGDIDTLCNTNDREFGGVISADGKYMAYNRQVNGTNNVWVMKLSDRSTKAITSAGNENHCVYPRWSPDGKRIFFQQVQAGAVSSVLMKEFTPF